MIVLIFFLNHTNFFKQLILQNIIYFFFLIHTLLIPYINNYSVLCQPLDKINTYLRFLENIIWEANVFKIHNF